MANAGISVATKKKPGDRANGAPPIAYSGDGLTGLENTLGGIRQRQDDSSTDLGKVQKKWIIDNPWFEGTIGLVAFLNAGQIGMALDLTTGDWVTLWKVTEHVFTTLFFCEMVLKLSILHGGYFKDRWNIMDFCLVVMAVIDNWILSWLVKDDSVLGGLTVFRIFRLARIARVFRMVRYMQELVSLIEALVYSIKTMFWAYALLLLMIYVYALICVEFIGSYEGYPARSDYDPNLLAISEDWNNYQFFGTVSRSMYSLFSIITLSEFSEISRPIFEMQPILVLVLISFTCLSAFGVMNVVVGLMVQQALDVSNSLVKDKTAQLINMQKRRIRLIRQVLQDLDEDGDRSDISKEELRHAVETSDELSQLLVQIDLPQSISIDELFTLIDNSGDGSVSPEEFQAQLTRLLDCNQFQQLCLMQISLNEIKRSLFETGMTIRRSVGSETAPDSLTPDVARLGCATESSSSAGDPILRAIVEIKRDMSSMRNDFTEKLDALLTHAQKSGVEASILQESTGVSSERSGVAGHLDSRLEHLPKLRAAGANPSVMDQVEKRSCEELPSEAESIQRCIRETPCIGPRSTPQIGLVQHNADISEWRKQLRQGCLAEGSCMQGQERQELNVERFSSNQATVLSDRVSSFKADRHCCPRAV